jgi:hypothetical protein
VLAVCGVISATRASSVAVNARPSIKAASIAARAGSPRCEAISAIWCVVAMAQDIKRGSAHASTAIEIYVRSGFLT